MDSLLRTFQPPTRHSLEWLRHQTPSRRDGLSYEKEEQYRQAYCQLMIDVGQKLRIPQFTVGTAVCYCHRFYASRSMRRNDRFTVAAAAMFLASKVEEASKGLDVIVQEFWEYRYSVKAHKSPEQIERARAHISDPRNQVFIDQVKSLVLVAERALLYTLGFDLPSFGAHRLVLRLSKEVGWDGINKELAQAAWGFVNDSLRTAACLQATSEEISWAVVLLTARLFDHTADLFLPDGTPRWAAAGVSLSIMHSVIEQIMSLYERTPPFALSAPREADAASLPSSPPPSAGRPVSA